MKSFALILAASLGLGWIARSEPVKIELPMETATFKNSPGAELAAGNCMVCHSTEYISTQPPLTRTAWKASVEKMRAKFGAPIPEDQVEKLVDYLTTAYGKPDPAK